MVARVESAGAPPPHPFVRTRVVAHTSRMPRARMLAPPSLSHTPRFLTVATADSATPVATVEPAAAFAPAAPALAAAEPGAADATDPVATAAL